MPESQKRRNRRRMRQNGLIAAIAVVLVVIVVASTGLVPVLRSQAASFSTGSSADYASFYGLTSEDAVVINYDENVVEETGLYLDGEVYIPYEMFHTYLNPRFYWDDTEEILRYVLPEAIVNASAETNDYTIGGEAASAEYPIVHVVDDEMYLSLSFLAQYTDIRYAFYEDPYRIVISDEFGEETYTSVRRNTDVRETGGIRSDVLTRVSKDDLVTVIAKMDNNWSEICTQDGFVGYVRNSSLGGNETLTWSSSYVEPEYTHIVKDFKINMAWHQVTNQTANTLLDSVLESTSGINILSPTWFYLNDNEGGIASLANHDYVSYCHERGIEVWALVSNFEDSTVDTTSVLNLTSRRDALIDNLMAEAVEYDLDGINVDFESLEGEAGTGFLEFIRELSVQCAAHDMVLSVDNYPPAAYNSFYGRSEQAVFADYVVLMAYDEHYNGSDEGSVASIEFVRQSVADTLEEVPADQLVLGIPFYTRLWRLVPTAAGYEVSSEALGMSEVQSRITENAATASITWLDDMGQYYAEYEENGITYEVWLEDATSIELKLDIMQENNLAGAAFWRLNYETADVWNTIAKYVP